jgi:hypothetical protein
MNTGHTPFAKFRGYLRPAALEVFRRAEARCSQVITDARATTEAFIANAGLDLGSICIACVGSTGRNEALEASDLDLVPILADEAALSRFAPHDQALRQTLRNELRIPVSEGADLTKRVTLTELTDPDSIGGTKDESPALTKRVLILTESQQIAGKLPLEDVRRAILACYASAERTSGRHVLSLCNDIARYYRTLCIEYKAKIDVEDKDWATRNIKLRHSRKLWYFSNVISITHLADSYPIQRDEFANALCKLFAEPPCARLVTALSDAHPLEVGNLLEYFSFFLDFMSRADNKKALAVVEHSKRYEATIGNPFPALKFNSDALHDSMIRIINGLGPSRRKVVLDWFLL